MDAEEEATAIARTATPVAPTTLHSVVVGLVVVGLVVIGLLGGGVTVQGQRRVAVLLTFD